MILTRWRKWCCYSSSNLSILLDSFRLRLSSCLLRLLLLACSVSKIKSIDQTIWKKPNNSHLHVSISLLFWLEKFKEKNCPLKSNWFRRCWSRTQTHSLTNETRRHDITLNVRCTWLQSGGIVLLIVASGVPRFFTQYKMNWLWLFRLVKRLEKKFCVASTLSIWIETIEFY